MVSSHHRQYIDYSVMLERLAVYPKDAPLALDKEGMCHPEGERALGLERIVRFASQLLKWIRECEEDPTHKAQVFALKRRIRHAIDGKHGGVGINGIKSQYEYNEALEEAIKRLSADSISMSIKTDQMPPCPEESYKEEHWESEIEICQKRIPEPVKLLSQAWHTALTVGQQAYHIANNSISEGQKGWWNEITLPNNPLIPLFLSALPSIGSGKNDVERLVKECHVGAALATALVYETTAKSGLNQAVTPKIWADHQVKFLQIDAADYQSMYLEQIQTGVAFIHWNVVNTRPTVIYSKTGCKRSALIVMCYLVKHQGMTPFQALHAIRKANGKGADDKELSKNWQRLTHFHQSLTRLPLPKSEKSKVAVRQFTPESHYVDNWIFSDHEELKDQVSNPFSPPSPGLIITALYRGRTHILAEYLDRLGKVPEDQWLFPLIEQGETEIVREVLDCKLKQLLSQEVLNRGLQIAAKRGWPQMVALLLKHQADPSVVINGKTVLHLAIESGNYSAVSVLVKMEQCREIPVVYLGISLSPPQYAVALGKMESFDALLNIPLKNPSQNLSWIRKHFNAQTSDGKTLLELAGNSEEMKQHLRSIYCLEMGKQLLPKKSLKTGQVLEKLFNKPTPVNATIEEGITPFLFPTGCPPNNAGKMKNPPSSAEEFRFNNYVVCLQLDEGLYNEAETLRGNYHGKIDRLSRVIYLISSSQIQNNKGDREESLRSIDEAIEMCKDLGPKVAAICHLVKGKLLINDDTDKALGEFFKALDLVNNHWQKLGGLLPQLSLLLAKAFTQRGEKEDEAIEWLQVAYLSHQSVTKLGEILELYAEALEKKGRVLARKEKLALAYPYFRRARALKLQFSPDRNFTHFGELCLQMGHYQEASEMFQGYEKKLSLAYMGRYKKSPNPQSQSIRESNCHLIASLAKGKTGEVQQATVTAFDGPFAAKILSALILLAKENPEEAFNVLQSQFSQVEKMSWKVRVDYFLALARTYRQMSKQRECNLCVEKAKHLLLEAVGEENPHFATALLLSSRDKPLETLEQYKKAMAILRRTAPSHVVEIANAHLFIAHLELQLNHYNKALDSYRQALSKYVRCCGRDSTYVAESLFGLAKTLMLIGEPEKGDIFCKEAEKIWEEGNQQLWLAECKAWRAENPLPYEVKHEVRKHALEDLLLLIPSIPVKENDGKGLAANDLPTKIDKLNNALVRALGLPADQREKWRKSLLIQIGDLYLKMGNWARAFKSYQQASSHTEGDLLLWTRPRSTLMDINPCELDPHDLSREGIALAYLGRSREAFLRLDLALKHLKKTQSLLAEIKYHRAVAYLLRGDEIKALEELKDAPDTFDVVKTRALAHLGLGRLHEANKIVLEIMEKHPYISSLQMAEGLLVLGNIQLRAGKHDEARTNIVNAKKLFEKWCGNRSPRYAVALSALGNTNPKTDFRKNVQLHLEALQMLKEADTGNPENKIPLLLDEANAVFSLAHSSTDKSVALAFFREALISYHKCFGLKNGQVVDSLLEMAKNYHAQKERVQARSLAIAAHKISQTLTNPSRSKMVRDWVEDHYKDAADQDIEIDDLDLSEYLINSKPLMRFSLLLKWLADHREFLQQTSLEASSPLIALAANSPDVGEGAVCSGSYLAIREVLSKFPLIAHPLTRVPVLILTAKALSHPRYTSRVGSMTGVVKLNRLTAPFKTYTKGSVQRMSFEAVEEVRKKLTQEVKKVVHLVDHKVNEIRKEAGGIRRVVGKPVVNKISQLAHDQVNPAVEHLIVLLQQLAKKVNALDVVMLLGPVNFYWAFLGILSSIGAEAVRARLEECRDLLFSFGVSTAKQMKDAQIYKVLQIIDHIKDLPKQGRHKWIETQRNSGELNTVFDEEWKVTFFDELQKLTKTELCIVIKRFNDYSFSNLSSHRIKKRTMGIVIKTGVTWLSGKTYIGIGAMLLAWGFSKARSFSNRSIEAQKVKKDIKSTGLGRRVQAITTRVRTPLRRFTNTVRNIFRRCCGNRRRA